MSDNTPSVHNIRQSLLGGLIAGVLVTGVALSLGASAQPNNPQPTPASVEDRLDEVSEQLRVIQGKLDKLLERKAQAQSEQPPQPAPARQIARSTVNGVTIRNQGRITLHSITVDQGSATITVNGERLGVVTAQPLYKDGRILRYEGTNQVTYEAVFSGNIVLTVTPGTDAPLKATVVYSR